MNRLNRLFIIPSRVSVHLKHSSYFRDTPAICFSSLHGRPKCNNQLVAKSYVISQVRNSERWTHVETRKEYILDAEELKQAAEKGQIYLVDVREPFETEEGIVPSKHYVHIPIGIFLPSMNISDAEFEAKFGSPKPSKDDNIVLMCKGGLRSTFALQIAQDLGYKNSKHYPGGWVEWSRLYGSN